MYVAVHHQPAAPRYLDSLLDFHRCLGVILTSALECNRLNGHRVYLAAVHACKSKAYVSGGAEIGLDVVVAKAVFKSTMTKPSSRTLSTKR